MSKIHVSAVEIKAPAEAIILNSSFVAKAVRAADVADRLTRHLEEFCPEFTEADRDPEGKPMKEGGKNWVEWMHRDFNCRQLSTETVADVYEKMIPFVKELCDALIGEDSK